MTDTAVSTDSPEKTTARRFPSARAYGTLLVVLGGIGFGGSLWLAIEKILKLQDPGRTTSCSINPFLDCSVAMGSWQGSLLGFPNPFIGVAAFPVVITTGVVLLAGARLPRWYHLWLLGGTFVGQLLVFFLMWTSFYALFALCPACMIVWTIMWPLLWYQVVRAVRDGDLRPGESVRSLVVDHHGVILAIGYVLALAWLMVAAGPALIGSF